MGGRSTTLKYHHLKHHFAQIMKNVFQKQFFSLRDNVFRFRANEAKSCQNENCFQALKNKYYCQSWRLDVKIVVKTGGRFHFFLMICFRIEKEKSLFFFLFIFLVNHRKKASRMKNCFD